MKILIISDIHGDYKSLNKVLSINKFDKLVILGDLLEYGIYPISENNEILNEIKKHKEKLILIKGNCDYMIDYDKFNLHAHDKISLTINKHVITFTHGHNFNKLNLLKYHTDILINGHTHVPIIEKDNNIIYLNPGSLGKPRYGFDKSYMIFDDNNIIIKNLNEKIIKKMKI